MRQRRPQDPPESAGPSGPSAERVVWLIRTGRMRAPANPLAIREALSKQTPPVADPGSRSLTALLEERHAEGAR
jgi:hypothetical protein